MSKMQITVIPSVTRTSWCVYELFDCIEKKVSFVWFCRFIDVMKLQKPMVNPEFDENKPYELTVLSFHKNRVEAYNEFSKVLRDKGFPYLNKTIKFNRYNPVQCDQTGQIWITATECAKERMLDVGQLGRHLRREVGFLSVKGNTYSFVIDNPGPPKKTEKKEPKKYEPGRLM